ncbi:MAG TPA: AraC family transcriptional regulator [Clostridiaceae bacterium]|nr:AraC family transcriptional regulator [Clostridiaceae bacterium]
MPKIIIKSLPHILFARPYCVNSYSFKQREYFLTEIIYVTEGCLEISFNNCRYNVLSGDCLVIPSRMVVDCRTSSDFNNNAHLGVGFVADIEIVEDYNNETNNMRFPVFTTNYIKSIENKDDFEMLFTKLISDYSNGNNLEAISDLFLLLSKINLSFDSSVSSKMNHLYVKKITDYINANAHKKISVKDIAKLLSITPEYASTIFKSVKNETILSYANKVKIKKAKNLLEHSQKSLGEIAEFIGMDNQSYFSRFFKKHVGLSPSAYRKIVQRQDIDRNLLVRE